MDPCGFHANFSQCISGYLSLRTLVCVCGRKTERTCACVRAPGCAVAVISAKASVPRHGASLRPRVTVTRNFFSMPVCATIKSDFVVNLLTRLLFFQQSPICSLTGLSLLKCSFVALKSLDPKPRVSKDARRFIMKSNKDLTRQFCVLGLSVCASGAETP